jgi:hypothetical protein
VLSATNDQIYSSKHNSIYNSNKFKEHTFQKNQFTLVLVCEQYFKTGHDIHDTNSNSKMQIGYLSLCPAVASENITTVKTPNIILLSNYQTIHQCFT